MDAVSCAAPTPTSSLTTSSHRRRSSTSATPSLPTGPGSVCSPSSPSANSSVPNTTEPRPGRRATTRAVVGTGSLTDPMEAASGTATDAGAPPVAAGGTTTAAVASTTSETSKSSSRRSAAWKRTWFGTRGSWDRSPPPRPCRLARRCPTPAGEAPPRLPSSVGRARPWYGRGHRFDPGGRLGWVRRSGAAEAEVDRSDRRRRKLIAPLRPSWITRPRSSVGQSDRLLSGGSPVRVRPWAPAPCGCSSAGQSARLLIEASGVRLPPPAPSPLPATVVERTKTTGCNPVPVRVRRFESGRWLHFLISTLLRWRNRQTRQVEGLVSFSEVRVQLPAAAPTTRCALRLSPPTT